MNKRKLVLILVLAILSIILYYQYFSYHTVSLENIPKYPILYSHAKVTLTGAIIGYEGNFFGPKYYLAEGRILSGDFSTGAINKIALAPKGGFKGEPVIDLSKYVSYSSQGTNYTQTAFKPVILKGTVVYRSGRIVDAPGLYLEVDEIKIDLD